MTITVELPDDIASHDHGGREALQALAIEGYRTEKLSFREARELLGMSRFEFEAFLKDREVTEGSYSIEQLLNDVATSDQLHARGLLAR